MDTIAQLLPTVTRELTTPHPSPMPLKQKFAEWLGFQTFDDAELVKAATAAQEWAFALDDGLPARWLSLIGSSGTGKTHIASRLWNMSQKKFDWSATRYSSRPIFWPDFIQQLRSGSAFELREDLKRWPVLFLDDIGAERDPSGFAAEELNTLLGCRMDRWTLLTSNKDSDSIRAIDERIASRLVRGNNICVGIKTLDYAERV